MKVEQIEQAAGAGPWARASRAREERLPVRAPSAPASAPGESLSGGAARVVASQVVLAAAGLGSLPVLARELGPAPYGQFSLFVALVGFVTYQDVARQLLIREETSRESSGHERAAVASASTLLVSALALAIGLIVLPAAAAALAVAAALHGLASHDFARLSAHGRVGFANAARNFAWAGAFLASTALAVSSAPTWTLAWTFAGANLALVFVYRIAAGGREAPDGRSALATLRASPHRARLQRAALDLLGFGLASSAIAVLDRVLLDELVGGEAFGVYCGAADIALRLHVISSALSAALFPLLSRELSAHGYEHAARRFVAITSAATPLYFAALALGLALAPDVLPWFLGESFRASTPIFIALLAPVFVHSFGFLATPWQRARGDFRTQRRAYVLAACLMVAVGLFAIPRWGAWGAVAAYAAARTAELQLLAVEATQLPRAILPRWKLAAAAALLATLAAAGAWRIEGL